jgi:5'-nucleotidase
MKNLPYLLLVAIVLGGCADNAKPAAVVAPIVLAAPPTPAAASAPPPPSQCLSIVAWNDMHGQLEPDTPVIDIGTVPAGGVIAVADQVSAIRATGEPVVLLDAGDLFTGPLASNLAEGAPIVDAYRVLGVDAAAVGNHEFDFGPVGYDRVSAAEGLGDEAGPDGPRGALLARMSSASFPFVSANIHKTGGRDTGWPGFHASVIVERGAFKVGVVGYTTKETPVVTLPTNVRDLDFATDASANVAREIQKLRRAGAAPVVLLAHASVDGELPQALEKTVTKGEIPALLGALGADLPDLIVAGHRHGWMLGRVLGVPIVSSDQHGVGISRARFCRSSEGTPRFAGIERRVALASVPPASDLGAAVAAVVRPYEEKVRAQAEAPITTLDHACAPRSPTGAALVEQIAEATADHVGDAKAPPENVPVVGLANAGGVRAPLPAGLVRFGDVFTMFPFENSIALCETTRAGLVRVVEDSLRREASRERFPFGISGAQLHLTREPSGALRLVSMVLNGERKGKTPSPSAPVWIATSDFLVYGGDGLLAGASCSPPRMSRTRVRDAFIERLERQHGGCAGTAKNIHIE